jgi:hypothetical protein
MNAKAKGGSLKPRLRNFSIWPLLTCSCWRQYATFVFVQENFDKREKITNNLPA